MNGNERIKKGISILLCLCMLVQNFPAVAFAATEDNLCAHHAGHTADCGYDEAAGQDCAYHCHICPVQELVNGLPEEVNAQNAEAVEAQLTAIDGEKASLSDEELAQVDFTKYAAAAEALGSVYAAVPAADAVISGVSITVDGIAYTSGNVTVKPDSTVILTVTGTNLSSGTEDNSVVYSSVYSTPVTTDFFVFNADGTSGTQSLDAADFAESGNYEIHYSNDYTAEDCTYHYTGIFVTYEGAEDADPVCTCEVKCSEDSINSECAVCSAEGADLTVCTGAEDADPVCTCETKCSEDSINSECAVCSAEGADLTACGGECTHETYENGVCTLCGAECTLDYDENGFCENGCFEPAEEADGVYQIGNAGNLFWFAQMINDGTEGPVDAVLTDDLDLEDREWIPIGTVSAPYSGMFDGSGHTISGLRLSQNTEFLQTGLFGSLSKAGIRNLTVSGSTAEDANANYAGMLAAEMKDSILYNCYASGNLVSTGGLAVGGLVGVAMHSVIINCGSSVAVNSTASDVGGLVGYMTAGYDEPMCLLNSYCTGTVSGTNAAGLVGYLADDALNNYYSGSVLFGEVGNSISVDDVDQTFTPLIEKNYYIPGDTGAIGSAATGLDTTGYAESYSSADDLLNKLNGNLAQVEEIISGHRGYLETSDWAELVELLDGASVTASHWRLVDGAVVHCSGSGTLSQWVPNAEGTAHVATWSCCGDTVTEEHTFDEETLLCICGGATADAVAMVTEDGVPQKAYTALADAITAVKDCTAEDKAAVVLLQSQELTAEQVIASGVFTLDLKGCTITGSDESVLNITGGTVTIDDSGENGAIQSAYTGGSGQALYIKRATVEIVGGTIQSARKFGDHGLDIYGGTVKISGGTVTGYAWGVMIGALADSDTMLQITGGTVHGGVQVGEGRAEITGGTVNDGVGVDGGTAEISGGEIGGVEVRSGSAQINGGTVTGYYAVGVSGGSAQISGGTITSEYSGVYVSGGSAQISGGTITGEASGVEVKGGSTRISGGSISGGSRDIYYTRTGTVPLTLTLDEGKTQGATFPGGITVKGTTLSAILAEGLGYWQGERMIIPAADWFAITGGDVTVQAACDHTGGTVRYSLTETGHRHILTYSCCGGSITENHSTTAEGDRAATCAVPAYCTVCRLEYGKVDLTNHDEAVNYENGFCPNGCYESAVLNGEVYEISNAGQLFWFAAKVNSGVTAINGKLMDNITIPAGKTWTPMGNRSYKRYEGTFDGCGRTISGLSFNDSETSYVGLFGGVSANGTVKNVGVLNCNITGDECVGGVVGYNDLGTVTGCYSTGTVSGEYNIGGVVGYNDLGTVTGCYSTATVSGGYDVGGVVGFNYDGTVEHCYGTGNLSGSDVGGVVGYNNGIVTGCYSTATVNGDNEVSGVVGYDTDTVTDCYYLADSETDSLEGTTAKTAAQFASGEVAYLLQGEQTEAVWGQNIGTDPAPIFSDAKVYYGYTSCGDAEMRYTNDPNPSQTRPEHTGEITYAPTDDGKKHVGTYSCCGTKFTENHGSMDSTTGKCGLCGAMVAAASVTKNGAAAAYYETLDEAIAAVADCTAEDNAVVKLERNERISNQQNITSGVFTFDLCGNTLEATNYGLYITGSSTQVTVADSGQNGGIIGIHGVYVAGSDVMITGGTFNSNIYSGSSVCVRNGTLTITGGTFDARSGNYGLIANNSTVIVKDGTFINNGGEGVSASDSTVTIENGTFRGVDYGVVANGSSKVTINGGSITGNTADLNLRGTGVIKLALADGKTQGATFPGGITVNNTTLTDVLGSGMAYWQNGKQVALTEGQTEITGGDVVIQAACMHENGEATYQNNEDGTHTAEWSCCGTAITEKHDFENQAHTCACGAVETFTVTVYDGNENIAVSLTNTTATFGQDFVTELTSDKDNPHYEIRWYTVNGENYENATYENGSLTIPAANITGDIEILVNPYVIVTLHGNGGICQKHEPTIREETMVFELRYAEEYRLFMEGAMIREGHEFVHFTTEANGSGTVYMQKTRYAFTEDLDLYAQWEANSYTLRLPDQSLDVTYGTTLADAVSGITPEKTGYRHTGWTYYRLNDDDNEEPYTGTTMPASELYARPVFEAIEYNITWDMAGCSYHVSNYSELPTKLAYNVDGNAHNVNFSEITAPEGYEFVRFEDGNGNPLSYVVTDMYRLTLTVSGDMTVKAVIEPKSYMATWERTDGGGHEKEFKYGEVITIPTSEFFAETFRKEGHTLTGWEGYTEGMTMPLDGITFTAIYQVNAYTITFDTDGGSPVQPITQDYGTAITAPAAPAREGFHFVKWDALPAIMPGKNVTVKALWEAHKDYTYSAKDSTITASCGICDAEISSLTLTAPEDCIYSGNPVAEAEVTGSIDGVTHTVRYTGTGYDSADAPTNAGDYTVILSAGGERVSDTFTISPKNLANCSVTLAENSFSYSGKAPQLTVTALDNGAGSAALTEGIDYSIGAVTGINAGTYKLTVTGTGNYTGSAELNYNITAKEVTITDATIREVTYDAAGYTLEVSSVTFSGVVEVETLDYSATAALTGGNTAGDQPAAVTVTLNNSNYTLKNGTFQTKVTIRKAASAVTTAPAAKELTYTGYPQVLLNPGTATGGTLVYCLSENGDYSANIPTGKSAETYTVWYYVAGDANHEDTPKESISITIGKADAAYTAPAANALTYKGEPQALVTAGTSADGKLMYKLGEDGTYAETIPTAENAGTYTVYWYVAGDSNHKDSAEKTVNVTIAKAVASVAKAPEAIADLVYNGSAQQLVTAGVPEGGVMMYNTLNNIDRYFTEQLPAGTFAREYYVYYYVKGDDNHENSAVQLVKVTLAHAEIDSIDVTIAAPEAGAVPQETIYYDGLYYARPNWSPSAEVFDFNTVYSATVQVLPKNTNAYMFSEEAFRDFKTRMEADGWTVLGSQKSMTLEKTFPATRKADVSITAADQTILYGQTIAADAYSVVSEVEGLTVSAVLQASTTNVTAGGTITPSAAVITVDGTDVTENYSVSYHSGKLVIAPDLSGIEGLTAENVTSDDTDAIKKVQEMLENADSLEDEWTEISDTCEELIDVIEDTAAEQKEVTEDAAGFDEDTVKSTDKEELQQIAGKIEELLDTGNLTEDERSALEDVQDQVNDMIDTIEDTAADSKNATDTINALDPATVTSADQDELEQAIDTIEDLLKDDHLTEEERAALEDAREDAEELIEKIETVQDALDTENTEKVEDVTAENVKPEDKDTLEDAREDLEEALQNHPDNYTEAERESIRDEIQRIEDAIEALENVEDVTEEITKLPNTVEPDDEETAEKILQTKENYDDLTDHEKSLVDETIRNKLENLVAALTDYKIIKGNNGKWMKGSSKGLSFTANGSYSKFTGIRVDGKTVDPVFYDAKSGSTIITLKQSFLKRLSAGKHTITVVYTDGEVSGTFRILAETASPPTGDDANILQYSIVLMTSFSALAALALVSRKRKKTT